MAMNQIAAERLREVLDYSIVTGRFYWKERSSADGAVRCNGEPTGRGYLRVRIDGVMYRLHRLAIVWVTGANPVAYVDHADGRRYNNAWLNLREATSQLNNVNRKRQSSTGYRGVVKTIGHRFSARIRCEGKMKHLGTWERAVDAARAYDECAKKLYGEFAILNFNDIERASGQKDTS